MVKISKHLLYVVSALCLLAASVFSQTPDASRLWITLDDHAGDVVTMYFGNATSATYCIDDGQNGSTNYFESIAPPAPPPPAWDARWVGVRTTAGNACIIDGLYPKDYRPVPVNAARRDTFRLSFGYILSP